MELLNHYQNMDGAMRLAIYDGKFYMLGDVLLNGYKGEIYGHTESGKSQSSYTMRKVVVENKKVILATGKISIFHVIAVLGDSENTNAETIIKEDSNTNIKLEASSDIIPDNTTIEVAEITSGETFNKLKDTLVGIKDFKVFDITLKSDGANIQPNGNVKISIPIPEGFDASRLVIYRFEEDGSKTEYQVKVENGYTTFETDHFSTYVLGEIAKISNETQDKTDQNLGETTTGKNNDQLPQTGEETNPFVSWLSAVTALAILWLGSMVIIDHEKKKIAKK